MSDVLTVIITDGRKEEEDSADEDGDNNGEEY